MHKQQKQFFRYEGMYAATVDITTNGTYWYVIFFSSVSRYQKLFSVCV